MAPLSPSCVTTSAHNSCNRSRVQRRGHEDKSTGSAAKAATKIPSPPERSASFHGRSSLAPVEQRQMRRPKTQPDLLSVARGGGATSTDSWRRNGGSGAAERRVPAKVLVNVSVQRSLLGPLQVMASSEWTVADLVAAVVRLYVKEGRRPQLPTADPSSFSLHYSQFSLESLDPKEQLIGLGSRNFFLCYKSGAQADADAAATTASTTTTTSSSATTTASSCSKQAEKASKLGIPWLRFIDSLF